MLSSTPLLVLRLYELAQVLGTVFGAYLVLRFGASKFLVGLYAGCVSIFFFDWIFTDSWFLNLTYDARSLNLFTLDGRPEPLWSPCSYATFFGVTVLLVLRYRHWLDTRLGKWQYLVLPAFIVVLDLAVEGFVIAALDVYRYGYRPEWTVFGVPYTNLIWVNLILLPMIWVCRSVVDMQHERGIVTMRGEPSVVEHRPLPVVGDPAPTHIKTLSPAGVTVQVREPLVMAAIGFSVCPTAFYLGIAVMTPVLQWISPWT